MLVDTNGTVVSVAAAESGASLLDMLDYDAASLRQVTKIQVTVKWSADDSTTVLFAQVRGWSVAETSLTLFLDVRDYCVVINHSAVVVNDANDQTIGLIDVSTAELHERRRRLCGLAG